MNVEDNQHIDELIGSVLADDVPANVDWRFAVNWRTFGAALSQWGCRLYVVRCRFVACGWGHRQRRLQRSLW